MKLVDATKLLYRLDLLSCASFAYLVLHHGRRFQQGLHMTVTADALESYAPARATRLVVNVPPRYGKSFIGSIVFPLFMASRHPGLNITCIAGPRELAADQIVLRAKLLASPRFRSVFPDLEVVSDRQGTLIFRNGSRLVQASRERSQVGRGSDLIVIDDPQSPTHAADAARRRLTQAWFAEEVMSRLDETQASIIVLGQRLHVDDLSGWLLSDRAWRPIRLPAIARDDEGYTLANGQRFVHRAGTALCPERQTLADLRRVFEEVGARAFLAQFLQEPTVLEDGRDHRCVYVGPMIPDDAYFGERGPTPRGGLITVPLAHGVRCKWFGDYDPLDTRGYRSRTTDEWEVACMAQQRRLLAESQRA